MKSGIFDKNRKEVKIGDVLNFPYINFRGIVTDEVDFSKTVEFKYGCFGYSSETMFIPLMEWIIKERGIYVPNNGNKIIYTENYYFWVSE